MIVMVEIIRWTCFLMVIGLGVVIGSIMVTSAQDPIIIAIDSPSEGETVYSTMITVSGRATVIGEQCIDFVTVNDVQAGRDTWSADITLTEGGNDITVVATTDTVQSSSETITVYYNPQTQPIQPPRYDGATSAIPAPTPTPTVSISITTIPSGANVWLDDSSKGTTPTLVNVTVGYHEIEVIKEGYDIYSETKKIRRGRGEPQKMIIELKPLTGSIYISSTTSGASVYLDDVYKSDTNTNCTLSEVVVGPHTITLKKSGYFDETRNVSVPADGPTSLHVTLRRCGYINISSNPPGANVYLDGNDTGETTPANISKVTQGNHIIKLTKLHYGDVNRTVSVNFSRTPPVDVNLTGYGSLSIDSDPSGARVYLDGNYTEVTPLYLDKLDEGNHSIRLTKQSYKDVTQEIHVSAGNTISVSVPLSLTCWGIIISDVMPVITAIAAVIAFIEFIYIMVFSERKKRN